MASVKINDEVLDRLRNYIALEYKGKMWGKVTSEIEIAITERLDRIEKRT